MNTYDPRCCGSDTCIIDSNGNCWCGQRWDGQKMCHVPTLNAPAFNYSVSDKTESPTVNLKSKDSV